MTTKKEYRVMGVAAIVLLAIVVVLLLSSCQQGEYVGKYTRDIVSTIPKGCVIGGSSPCAQVSSTHYYFVMKSCDSTGSCTQYEVEVSEGTYNSKP